MKEMMKKILTFITFDLPLQRDYISDRFKTVHDFHQIEVPLWSTAATRHKMVSEYWFDSVIKHFLILLGLALLTILVVTHDFRISIVGLLLAGLTSFSILYFFHYKPLYFSIFLPGLETAKEEYEQKFREQLSKCRQAQLLNFTLVLIYYVFAQCLEISIHSCDENSASLLTTLFGVDGGSIKKNLAILLLSSKRKDFTERRKTEFRNRFDEAYNFFNKIGFTNGVSKLKQLEMQFFY